VVGEILSAKIASLRVMPSTDDLYAPVQQAIVAVQTAATQLTEAVKQLPGAGADVASGLVDIDSSKLTDAANAAGDQAMTSLAAASEHVSAGIASLTAAAQAAIDKVKSANQ